MSTGETGEEQLAQDRDSLAGKILRITPAGKPAPGNPRTGSPVWTMGHRNVQGLAFDDRRRLWATEFGAEHLGRAEPHRQGPQLRLAARRGQGRPDTDYRNPFVQWRTSEASPSGLAYLDGSLWAGALRGRPALAGPGHRGRHREAAGLVRRRLRPPADRRRRARRQPLGDDQQPRRPRRARHRRTTASWSSTLAERTSFTGFAQAGAAATRWRGRVLPRPHPPPPAERSCSGTALGGRRHGVVPAPGTPRRRSPARAAVVGAGGASRPSPQATSRGTSTGGSRASEGGGYAEPHADRPRPDAEHSTPAGTDESPDDRPPGARCGTERDRAALPEPARVRASPPRRYASCAAAGGAAAWLTSQLDPGSIAESHAAARCRGSFPDMDDPATTKWAASTSGMKGGWEYAADLAGYSMLRRVYSSRQVLEKMVDFWSNHLHVHANGDSAWVHRGGLRRDRSASTRSAASRTCSSPARCTPRCCSTSTTGRSVRNAPNENQGRELLELHTRGPRRRLHRADGQGLRQDPVRLHRRRLARPGRPPTTPAGTPPARCRCSGFTDANAAADGSELTVRYLRYLAHHPATAPDRRAPSSAVHFVVGHALRRAGRAPSRRSSPTPAPTSGPPCAPWSRTPSSLRSAAACWSATPIEDFVATCRVLGVQVQAAHR